MPSPADPHTEAAWPLYEGNAWPTHRADCEGSDCNGCRDLEDAPRLVCHACGRAYARTPIGGMCRVKMCFGVVRVEGTE